MTDSLLPRNATDLERALETIGAADPGLDRLRTLTDPERIPTALLPWLAWAENVPSWPDDEASRRRIIANSHRLHGLIGTLAGLRAGAQGQAAALRHCDRPPGRTFLGGRDPAATLRWRQAQPELRLYPRRVRQAAEGCQLGGDFPGACWPGQTTAITRAAVRATRVINGVETELTVAGWSAGQAAGTVQVAIARRAAAAGCQLGGDFAGASHLAMTTAGTRVWTIGQYRYPTWSRLWRLLAPGFAPLSADAEAVAARGAEGGLCCLVRNYPAFNPPAQRGQGQYLGAAHPSRAAPETRLYWRLWLFDPSVAVPTSQGLTFLGRARLNLPPFYVEAGVRWPLVRAESALLNVANRYFPAARATAHRVRQVLDHLAWYRAEADSIKINPHQHDRLRASLTLSAGDSLAGAIVLRN